MKPDETKARAVSVICVARDRMGDLMSADSAIRNQGDAGTEWIIISDGSTDGTLSWLRGSRGLIWRHERRRRGWGRALKRGWKTANGDTVCVLPPDRLSPGCWIDPVSEVVDIGEALIFEGGGFAVARSLWDVLAKPLSECTSIEEGTEKLEAFLKENGNRVRKLPFGKEEQAAAETPQAVVSSADTRLRVLFDARCVLPREQGIGMYALELIRALGSLPDRPMVHCATGYPNLLERELGASGDWVFHPVKIPLGAEKDADRALCRLAESTRAEIFHGPSFAVPQGLSIPSVVTIHDLTFLLFPQWYEPKFAAHVSRVAEGSLRQATRIIADSRCTLRDLHERFPDTKSRVDVVPLSLVTRDEDDRESNKPISVSLDRPYFLTVGVQNPRKNAVGLVRAFARFSESAEEPCRLVLVGGKECRDPGLLKTIAESKLTKDVILTGHIPAEELQALYRHAHAFVFPSYYEGFGLPILEAMAEGVPVICSNAGSLPEVAGDAALAMAPDDETALADAMKRIASESDLRSALIEKGAKRVREFSWTRTARETLRIYREAVSDAARPIVHSPNLTCPLQRVALDVRVGDGESLLHRVIQERPDIEYIVIGPEKLNLRGLRSVIQHIVPPGNGEQDRTWEQFTLPSSLPGCDFYIGFSGFVPIARSFKAIAIAQSELLSQSRLFDSFRSAEAVLTQEVSVETSLLREFQIPRERIRVSSSDESTFSREIWDAVESCVRSS